MRMLESQRRASKSGKVSSLVIFVHGYGADGNDLISLGSSLDVHMPDTVFYAPNAPNRCKMSPVGFEWFPIPWIDGSSEEVAKAGMEAAVTLLDGWLGETMNAEGVSAAQTVLVGFSQGTMMSLHVGPRRSEQLAGIVGFSGRLLEAQALDEVKSKPPILLVHGDSDEVVSPSSMPEAADALTKAGFDVRTHVSKGIGHGIAPDGLELSLRFMLENLSKA